MQHARVIRFGRMNSLSPTTLRRMKQTNNATHEPPLPRNQLINHQPISWAARASRPPWRTTAPPPERWPTSSCAQHHHHHRRHKQHRYRRRRTFAVPASPTGGFYLALRKQPPPQLPLFRVLPIERAPPRMGGEGVPWLVGSRRGTWVMTLTAKMGRGRRSDILTTRFTSCTGGFGACSLSSLVVS